MLWEATCAMLFIMFSMWAFAIWASYKEDFKKPPDSGHYKERKAGESPHKQHGCLYMP